jgi:enoyl-CoA hydratase
MSNIKTEIINQCGVITVDRPQALNAMNSETIDQLRSAFRTYRSDNRVGVVILTGSGDKAFIAGADIQQMAQMGTNEALAFARLGQDLTNLIERYPKPVIAAINGYALGGGCEIALACHIRIAADNAKIGQPEVKLGIIPGWGGTQRLPRLVGKGKAIELITTGNMISAQEALEIGLVNHVVPQEDLMSRTFQLAQDILKAGPMAVRLSLEAIHRGLDMSQGDGMVYESHLFGLTFGTAEKEEGTRAFIEKREPQFSRE